MQKAKEAAGKLVHQAEDCEALSKELGDLSKKAKTIKDFKDAAEVTEAERIMENIDASVAKASAANAKLEKLIELASPSDTKKGSAAEYMPIMHFVDKKYDDALNLRWRYGEWSHCGVRRGWLRLSMQ